MAVDTAAKRASALAGLSRPYMRLVVPDGSVDRAAALGLYNGFAAGGDVTAPTVSSWTIATNGLSSSVVFSEAVTRGADGITGLVLTPTNGGASVTLSYTSGDGTNTLVIGHSRAVSSTETFTRSYTQPGDGIKDTASPANVLASFSGQAVTNNSTVNAAPSDISITNYTISVSAADGAQLGILSAVDADAGDSFTWALSVGTGDTNNSAVAVGAATGIVTVNSASTLGVGNYTFRAQITDSATNTRAEAFAFSVVIQSGVIGDVKQSRSRSNRRYPTRV